MSDSPPETPAPTPEEPQAPPPQEAPPVPPTPPAEMPPPAYGAVPPAEYAEPPMGMPPVMAPPAKRGSALRTVIIAVVLVAVILVAIIGYAVVGFASGESKVSAATKSLNAVIDDQNKLTATVDEIDTKITKFSTSSSSFDPNKYKSLASEFAADSQAGVSTVDADSATIAAADPKLDESSWLTVIDKSNIDKMHTRLGHATKGLVAIRVVLAGYVEDGKFYVALGDALIDLDKLGALQNSNDFTAVVALITSLKAHVATAVQLSTATGLPPEVHAFMVDFQSLADDFNNLVNAAVAGDDAGVTNYLNKITADTNKMGTYDFNKMDTDRDAFYKQYIDTFNSEFAAATA